MTRILVIDDDIELLQMVRLMLERAGFEVFTSADGADGIEKTRQLRPDLVILDLMMPEIDGFQVLQAIRNDPLVSDTPVLVLTARAQPVDREAALAARADDYLAKPVSQKELLDRVQEVLNRRRPTGGHGSVVLFLGLRGGTGTTTLAVNTALALIRSGPVVLWDASLSSGHAGLHLRIAPRTSWLDWWRDGCSKGNLEAHLMPHPAGLSLFPAPLMPVIEAVEESMVGLTLDFLRERFAFVVIDGPSTLVPLGLIFCQQADQLFLVMSPEVGALQTTVMTLRVLQSAGIPMDRTHIVVNHAAGPGTLSPQTIERALGRAPMLTVPFDPNQAVALVQGTPLVLSHSSGPLASAAQRLAGHVISTVRQPGD
ncbi:response regulator [Thermoflexus sp.]|uniref:response regulator n=1 Tax=Thermoflexus sp. TaxID=1969742 RepID=UPI002ADE80F2|nr:response regulator [Thermoflexus sp.]